MPSRITGTTPVDPRGSALRNVRGHERVNMRLALEPGNNRHKDCEVKVSSRQFEALRVANQAIQDTHQILHMGVGDQARHSISTNAETFKRQIVMRKRIESQGLGPLGSMWEAQRFRVGNCGELAMVCGQLIASSGLNQTVTVKETRGSTDHTYVEIGDPNSNEEKVIADPWGLFSRAMLEKNFYYASDDARIVHQFTPAFNPGMKNQMLSGGMVSRADVDREFGVLNSQMGNISDRELLDMAADNKWIYNQYHTSKNLGENYRNGSGSDKRYISQNMTKSEYQQIFDGPRPSASSVPRPPITRQAPPTAYGQSRTSRRNSFAATPDVADQMRRMSLSDADRPRRSSFVDTTPRPVFTTPAPVYRTPAPAPAPVYRTVAPTPEPVRRYSVSGGSRPVYYATPSSSAAQASSSSEARRARRRRERESQPSSSNVFSSFFRRR